MKKIAITGGGSGGHCIPAISYLEYLSERENGELKVVYMGSYSAIESKLIPALNLKMQIAYRAIATGKLRRYWSIENITDIPRVFLGIYQAFLFLWKERPEILISFGGFVSVPVVLAAYLLRVPILVHEQTVTVGLANRIGSLLARKVGISFPSSLKYFPQHKTQLVGLPIRASLERGSEEHFNQYFPQLKSSMKPLIYVTGGGQGSVPINQALLQVLPSLLKKFRIIHQCGAGHLMGIKNQWNEMKKQVSEEDQQHYVVDEFFNESLKDILKMTSLLIGRAGAGTVYECWQLGIPALFIPLPFATKNEQFENALYLYQMNKASLIQQKNLNQMDLAQVLDFIFDQKQIKQTSTEKEFILTLEKMKKAYENDKMRIKAVDQLHQLVKEVLER